MDNDTSTIIPQSYENEEVIEIETPSGVLTIEPRNRWSSRWNTKTYHQWNKLPRVSVWGDASYETDVYSMLNNRTRRPTDIYKKGALKVIEESGIAFDATKMRWSQYAWCTCPCSPAFIAMRQPLLYGNKRYDTYDLSIILKGVGNVDETKAGRLDP